MLFGLRYFVNRNSNLFIKIDDENLQMVPTYKYMGVHLDQTMSFNYHLKNIINKIAHKIYVFS